MSNEPDNLEKTGYERDESGRFLPGHKGIGGRPKFSLVSIIKEELEKYTDTEEKETIARKMIQGYIRAAVANNDGVSIRDLVDRIDGKPKQKQEIEFSEDVVEGYIEALNRDE